MQVTCFLNGPMLNLLFYCHIIQVTFYEKFSDNFSLEIHIVWKISVLQECGSWASRNGAVQMLFLAPNRTIAGKFVKSERVLAALR